jgi:hypothetical protein
MPAGKYSLLIEQGATLNLSLSYKDSAGSLINLTGYSGKMQIKSDYADNSPTTYLTLSSSLQPDGTGIVMGGVSGTIGIYISATTSSALTFSSASYDLEIASGSFVTRLIQGPVFVSKEVTR